MFEDNSIYEITFNSIDEIYDTICDIIDETNEIKMTYIQIKPIKNRFYTKIYFNKSEYGINLHEFTLYLSLLFEEMTNPQKLFSFTIKLGNIYIKYINEFNF